nr:dentin sialophosphoprotein-like isoform X1 [Tanacetum cinerariifolium]
MPPLLSFPLSMACDDSDGFYHVIHQGILGALFGMCKELRTTTQMYLNVKKATKAKLKLVNRFFEIVKTQLACPCGSVVALDCKFLAVDADSLDTDKIEEENGVRSSDDGIEKESEKDDVDKCKKNEDAIEKMNETEHVSEETRENDENKKNETEATQENDAKYNEKSESEDNHNEDDHVKEVDNVNENENKSDGNDQSVRDENRKGDDASSEVLDDSQKTAKPIQRSRWCLKM